MTGRVAVVTGAGGGIGAATTVALAERGLTVVALGRTRSTLETAAERARALGARAEVQVCDVADAADVQAAKERVLADLGAPSVVVNAAGIVRRGPPVEEVDPADWDAVIATNLRGAFLVSRAFLGAMRAAGRGRLIHVGSISSTLGCPGNASYAASKWGLVGLSKSIAEELRGTDVQSMALLPGSVDTEMLVGSGFAPAMTAAEVAAQIVYLALDAPAAMNGAAVEMFG